MTRNIYRKGHIIMKYKILVSGDNSMFIKDFFQYTEQYFDCLTTSDIQRDIIGHFELFKPDVFLIFAESENSEILSRAEQLRSGESGGNTPVVIVGRSEICMKLQRMYPTLAELYIKRPVSPDNLALAIIDFLDRNKLEKLKEKAAKEQSEENGRKHILVVDDDRTVLKMLKTALSETYEVTAMLNGVLVEKFLESKKVDVIILDYEMPIMTGADVYRQIKLNPKTADIPICFLTGVSERSKVAEIMQLRPRGYLLKPINMEMLLSTISNLTET